MILVEKIIGNITDPVWVDSLKDYEIDELFLEQWEAPKTRIRKKTNKGYEMAISLPRDQHLKNRDIVYIDHDESVVVIIHIALKDVMVIHLHPSEDNQHWQKVCFQLGHALGNQHWPAIFKDNVVYVPFYVDQKIMTSVIRTHAFEGIRFEFLSGEEVAPLLDINERRLLFASAETSPHQHQSNDEKTDLWQTENHHQTDHHHDHHN